MKQIQQYSIFALLLLFAWQANAQQEITLEHIYKIRTFAEERVRGINWMNDGQFYSAQEQNSVVKYNVATGDKVETLVDGDQLSEKIQIEGYEFSPDEKKILLYTNTDYIYRRSFKAEHYVYELSTKKLTKLSAQGAQSNATFSPDGSKVAFTRDNNLFFVSLADMKETAITTDGKFNSIIQGSTDWVYEEEFYLVKAFWWSPDGQKIAYLTLDESAVREYNMQLWKNAQLYPEDYRYKYPKAGEANSLLTFSVYDLGSSKKTAVDIGQDKDIYIPRATWVNASTVAFKRVNRLQNHLEIFHADAATGQSKKVYDEQSDTYVDITYCDEWMYLKDGKHFLISSEKNGFKHVYKYTNDGALVAQVTQGNFEVTSIEGLDETAKVPVLYYTSTEISPLERHVYSLTLDGKKKAQLTTERGTNSVEMSKDCKYYIHNHTSTTSPLTVKLVEMKKNTMVKVLKDNAALRERLKNFNLSAKELFTFKTTEGIELNGYMLKPSNFDASKKYPVLMFQYSGPGSQEVKNAWAGGHYFWHQMMAQKGYMIVVVDGRGTGFRGEKFTKSTYKQLGKYETLDQIETAKYLGGLPYVDKSRIGIWGWSYGGYMSSLCMMIGADYFKTGIAVAPVTTWRFYDTIYTERYLQRPQDNASGYDDNSPLNHVSKLKGNFLLIHGTGDDNVHFQNAVALENALIEAGKQFRSFYYPDRAHGLRGGNSTMHLYEMLTNYIVENL